MLYSKPRDDADARLFRRLSDEAYGTSNKPVTGSSIQGHYVLSADGDLLAFLQEQGDKHLVVDAPTTVENIVPWLAREFQAAFDLLDGARERGVRLVSLRVHETPNCYADWHAHQDES